MASQKNTLSRHLQLLIITDDMIRGGTAINTCRIAHGLARWFSVTVGIRHNDQNISLIESLHDDGITTIDYPAPNHFFAAANNNTLAYQLLSHSVDVILFSDSGPGSSLSIKRLASFYNIPYVTLINAVHDNAEENFISVKSKIASTIRAASELLFVSDQNRRVFFKNFRKTKRSSKITYNFAPLRFFNSSDNSSDKKRHLKEGLGFSATDIIFTVVGRLEKFKGQHHVIDALRLLRNIKEANKFRLLLVGELNSNFAQYLKLKIKRLNLSEKIIFTGSRADIEDLLEITNVVVLPSHNEGLPLSLLEAMAKSLPVIASNVGGIPELFENEIGILLPNPKHHPMAATRILAEAMLKLGTDPNKCIRLGANARNQAEIRFHPDVVLQKIKYSIEHAKPKRFLSIQNRLIRPRIKKIRLGEKVSASEKRSKIWHYLAEGWSGPQKLIWSDGPKARLVLQFQKPISGHIEIQLQARPFTHPKHPVQNIIIGLRIDKSSQDEVYRFQLTSPADQLIRLRYLLPHPSSWIEINFKFPNCKSPATLNINEDSRELGLGLRSLIVQ